MNIKTLKIEALTHKTCIMNDAENGFACNKTVFLLQNSIKNKWEVVHYENDRFGLLNGILYLKDMNIEPVDIVLKRNDVQKCHFIIRSDIPFSEISKMIDQIYHLDNVTYGVDNKMSGKEGI